MTRADSHPSPPRILTTVPPRASAAVTPRPASGDTPDRGVTGVPAGTRGTAADIVSDPIGKTVMTGQDEGGVT